MKATTVALIRALSGGEVDDRELVKVARAVRLEGGNSGRVSDALVRALERADGQELGVRARRIGIHTAAGALFGGLGGAAGLWTLGSALEGPTRYLALAPLLGVVMVVVMMLKVRRMVIDELALPVAVAHELMCAEVSPKVALDAAAVVAGARAPALRALLADPTAGEPRVARAVLSVRYADPTALEHGRQRARRGVLLGAVWVVLSFWLVWIYGLTHGLRGLP